MNPWPVEAEVAEVHLPRPGHADLVGRWKYGLTDVRNVLERASARETAARVAGGALAKAFLRALGVEVRSHVVQIGPVAAPPRATRRCASRTSRASTTIPCAAWTARRAARWSSTSTSSARRTSRSAASSRSSPSASSPGLGSHVAGRSASTAASPARCARSRRAKGVDVRRRLRRRRAPGLAGPRRDLLQRRARLLPRDQPRRRPRGRHDHRRAAGRARGDEADADADQAAALGRHRHARAGRGAARAHRLRASCRRPGSWGRRWSPSCWPTPTARSSAATTSTTCSRPSRATRSASGGAALSPPSSSSASWARASRARRARPPRRSACPPSTPTPLLEAQLGEPIEAFFDARRRGGVPRARGGAGRRAARGADGGVIALGGGALGSERVRAALARHVVALLDVDLDTAWARAHESGRPLARERGAFAALYGARRRVYEAARRRRPARDRRAASWRARSTRCGRCPQGHRLLWATSASGDYPVWVGAAGARAVARPRAALVITDETVAALHGRACPTRPGSSRSRRARSTRRCRRPSASGASSSRRAPPAPITSSRWAAASSATSPASARPPTSAASPSSRCRPRSSPRSTRPTAARPASTCPEAKNYVGAYHQPIAVLTDPGRCCRRSPPQERAAGYAEVVKTALIAGGALWERVAAGGADRRRGDRRLRAHEAARRGRRRARRRRAPGAQPRPHRRPRDRDRHRLRALPPRRGGRARAARRPAPLRARTRCAPRSSELLARPGLPTRLEGVDADAVVEATARDKKRTGEAVPLRPGRRARPASAPATRSATPSCSPPCESCRTDERSQPRRGHARGQPRPARPASGRASTES